MIARMEREFGPSHALCTFYENGTDPMTGISTTLVTRHGSSILFQTSAKGRVTVLEFDNEITAAMLADRRRR